MALTLFGPLIYIRKEISVKTVDNLLESTKKVLGAFTPALYSPVESNPGAFSWLVRFVWVGVNTVRDLLSELNNRTLVRLKEVVSDGLLVNSGAVHCWCERSPHQNIGSVVFTCHKNAGVFISLVKE